MPKKNTAYTFNVSLFDMALSGKLKANPTLATGDVKVSKDNGAFANLGTLPTVTPSGGTLVQVALTSAEMNADRVSVQFIDPDGEWADATFHFVTDVQSLDDIPTANANADALLKRDWTAVAGDPPTYSVWNALRFLRNVWSVVSGAPPVLHVKKEDGSTDAWTRNVATDAAADPITGLN